MNILYLNYSAANGSYKPNICCDYQMDSLFLGLKELDHFVYDFPKIHHLYKDCSRENTNQIWGKGFSTCFQLDDRPRLDDKQINNYDWDLVIFPLHHSIINEHEQQINIYKELQRNFSTKKIVIVDGHDLPRLQPIANAPSIYFKRELYQKPTGRTLPIHFGIPEQKIMQVGEKIYDVAPLIPVNQNIDSEYMKTYIYNDEESYYGMYNKSRYSLTSKKGSWGSMRDLEIMAAGSLPYFVDIENCPEYCLHDFPKRLFKEIKQTANIKWNWKNQDYGTVWPHCGIIKIENPGKIENLDPDYDDKVLQIQDWLKEFGTTKSIANYLLERVI